MFPLLPGSPAINASNSPCPNGVTTDQRSISRSDGACDSGAFESRGFSLTKVSGDNQSTGPGSAFAAPLVVSVSSSAGEPVDGGVVTFTGPAQGAGIATSPATATIGASTPGQASLTPTRQ